VPLRGGLAITTAALLCFTVPDSALVLSALIVVTVAALAAFWTPTMAMVSDVAEARGVNQALAAALINLAWSAGQIIGSGGGGAIARAAGDLVPTAIAASLCMLTLLAISR
jgi:predicted MFS family arabinose efflux permease